MGDSYTIITGGLGGLGSAFAVECAQRGMNLILIDRYPDADKMLAYLCDHYRVDVRYFSCNLTDEEGRRQLFETFKQEGFNFSGLVNVVGREFEGPYMERTPDEVNTMLELNLGVMLNLTLSVLKMRDVGGRFTLINIASLGGFFPMPNKAIYSSTKRFIINFTLALRREISDFANVTVVCPGGLPTNPESMKKIFLQGFWGKMTALDTTTVVRRALNHARRNKPIYIPGLASKFLVWLSRILPEAWVASFLSHRWKEKIDALEFWRITDQQRRE